MPLVVETGAGLANAESFISVTDATTYHAARGNAAWAALASDTVREQVLRQATDYMEQVYGLRWAGMRKTDAQALAWPRYMVPRADSAGGSYWPDNAVPVAVANACAELALKASTGALAPDIGRLKSKTKVGPIQVEYADNATPYTQYRAIDNMLAQFLDGSSGLSRKVVRT
jgi:hypothetical protein